MRKTKRAAAGFLAGTMVLSLAACGGSNSAQATTAAQTTASETTAEYSETKIDKDDLNPPLLFVFGKDINSKLVYVKLKIKGNQQRHVLCVSFHYEKEKMLFPYA